MDRLFAAQVIGTALLLASCTGSPPKVLTSPSSPTPSIGPAPSAVPGASAFVRLNQVSYDLQGPKRAYLMSSVAETGAIFTVVESGGRAALSAGVGGQLGPWSRRYPFVYALEFGQVTGPGTYSISLVGPAPASSPLIRIDTGANLYAQPLANALFFYQAERDGPDYIPSPLRTAPAHLNDRSAMTYSTPK